MASLTWAGDLAERERKKKLELDEELPRWEEDVKEAIGEGIGQVYSTLGPAEKAGPGLPQLESVGTSAQADGRTPLIEKLMAGRLDLEKLRRLTLPSGLAIFCSSTFGAVRAAKIFLSGYNNSLSYTRGGLRESIAAGWNGPRVEEYMRGCPIMTIYYLLPLLGEHAFEFPLSLEPSPP